MTEPEQWQKDVEYLAKLADYCAGQGFCQIEGLDDPEDWCLEAYDSFYPMRYGDNYSAQALADGLIASIQRAFEERTGQLIPAPSVDDAMVERCAIFRQIGRWEMAQEIAFQLEQPLIDCTEGKPEQASFDTAAKMLSMSIAAKAGRAFSDLPLEVQFGEGEWAEVLEAARQALSDKTQRNDDA